MPTQNANSASTDVDAKDPQRRSLALALLGVMGSAALLEGCDGSSGDAASPSLDEVADELLGTSALKWVDNITDLKSVTGQGVSATTTSTVVVLGRTTRGDGAGGVFVWIKATPPAADDGGIVFLPNAQPGGTNGPGYWKRLYSGPINVKWFGALGGDNPAQPDHAAIAKAISAAKAAGGGTVYFPPGIYWTGAPLTIDSPDIKLLGSGRNSAAIKNQTSDVIVLSGSPNDFQCKDMWIEARTPGGHVFKVSTGTAVGGIHMEDTYLVQSNPNKSIWEHAGAQDFTDNLFENCKFEHTLGAAVPAWNLLGPAVNANTWERCKAVYSGSYFFRIEPDGSYYAYDNVLRDIDWEVCNGGLVEGLGVNNLVIENCTASDFTAAISKDLYYIGTSSTGIKSKLCNIRNSHRRAGSFSAGIVDIRLVGSSGYGADHLIENCSAAGDVAPTIDVGGVTATLVSCPGTITNSAAMCVSSQSLTIGGTTLDNDGGGPDLRVSGGLRVGGSTGARIKKVWYGTKNWDRGPLANGAVDSTVVTITNLPSYGSASLLAVGQLDGNAGSMEARVTVTALPYGSDGVILTVRNDSGAQLALDATRVVRVAVFEL